MVKRSSSGDINLLDGWLLEELNISEETETPFGCHCKMVRKGSGYTLFGPIIRTPFESITDGKWCVLFELILFHIVAGGHW